MADIKSYLQNNDGNNLLPITDFNYLLNTPTVLQSPDKIKTTDNLLTDTGWITDGVTLGANTKAANTADNSAPKYRVVTIGSIRIVTLQGTISGGNGTLVTYPSSIGLDPNKVWVSLPTNNSTKLLVLGNTIKTADEATDNIADYTSYYICYIL